MEKIVLKRTDITDKRTFGELWYNNEFICFTLEDPIRDIKIKHETAIPYGSYQVIINMSPKFKQKMPRLLNVPNFEGILIHKGFSVQNSSGCILVGMLKSGDTLLHSPTAYSKVFLLIQKLLKKGEVWVDIIEVLPEVKLPEVVITETPKVVEPTLNTDLVTKVETNVESEKKTLNSFTQWKKFFHNLSRLILTWLKPH